MGVLTPFFNLFKPAKTDAQRVAKLNENFDIIDTEMHRPPLTVNEVEPDASRNIYLESVPLADNLASDIAQLNHGTFIERASGGTASLENGTASIVSFKGNMIRDGYVPESIDMTVNAVTRTAPAAITATLDKTTFEEKVENEPGTYTLSYTDSWDETPSEYGVTVTNVPVNGDSITITWDGENDPVLTVNAVTRTAPPEITASLNRATFVAYVASSSTIVLTYTSGWSADPALYGITVTNTPVSGDTITVVYVKENRGTITTATPTTFNSTGWNLYDNTTGYAKVVKYSEDYPFMIGGTYSLLEFATTVSGTRTGISAIDGYFTIPSDGYVFVTGGDATTYILMTWSNWVDGYPGDFETYTVDTIDLTEVMLNFPYGLLAVGNIRDEINLNAMTAINRVERLAYTAENLALVEASGVAYTYDTNYIYAALEEPESTSIELDGNYTVNDHGIEFFTGTTVPVVTETLYGENLKDKLRTDVLTISAQTLTTAQQNQVAANLGIARSTLRDVPFAVGVSDWTLSNGTYTANFTSAYITATSKELATYDASLRSYAQADILIAKKTGGGGMVFTTTVIPTGTISGTLYVFDNDDNKIPTLIENTVTPVANGGTGQSTLSGAKQVLGITALSDHIANFQLVSLGGIEANQTKTIYCESGSRILLCVIGSNSENSNSFLVCTTNAGLVVSTPLATSAGLTISTNTNILTITTTRYTEVFALLLSGNKPY